MIDFQRFISHWKSTSYEKSQKKFEKAIARTLNSRTLEYWVERMTPNI